MVDKATLPQPSPPVYSDVVRPVEGHEEDGRVVEVYDPDDQNAKDGWVRVTRPGIRQRPVEGAPARRTHAELDAAAAARSITFAAGMTVAQKEAVLEEAK